MIAIIGSGLVGSSIAFLCASNQLTDLVLLNRTKSKAIGEALDISNTIPANSNITVRGTNDYRDIKNAKIIIVTASAGAYKKNRNEAIHVQVKMIKEISKKIKKNCNSPIILVVSNPVDVLTYFCLKETKYPKNRVIGIASSLDGSRFRHLISKELKVKYKQIKRTQVLGEHGDTMVPIFSRVKINGKKLTTVISLEQKKKIKKDLRDYWKSLRKYKSRSQFGIAKKVYDIVEVMSMNRQISIEASVMLNGEFGESNVSMGVPVEVSSKGIVRLIPIKINEEEQKLFEKSANNIRRNIHSLEK